MSIHAHSAPFIHPQMVMPVPSIRRQRANPRYQMPINFFYHALAQAGWDKIIALVKKP